MRYKIVSFSEFFEDNPFLCMSAERASGNCQMCDCFKSEFYKEGEKAFKLRCKPKISEEMKKKLKKYAEKLEEIRKIKREKDKLA